MKKLFVSLFLLVALGYSNENAKNRHDVPKKVCDMNATEQNFQITQRNNYVVAGDLYDLTWGVFVVSWKCAPASTRCFAVNGNVVILYECGTNVPLRTFNVQDGSPVQINEEQWEAYLAE